jgi:hypothetical protein
MNQGNLRGTGIRKLPSGRYQIAFRDGNGVKHRESFDREKDARTLSAIFDKHLALRTIHFNPVTLAERMARGSNEVGENDEIDVDALEVRPEEVYGPDQILKLIQSAERALLRPS